MYIVNTDVYSCTCLSFPLIRFCKHVCAVQHFFQDDDTVNSPHLDGDASPTPSSSLSDTPELLLDSPPTESLPGAFAQEIEEVQAIVQKLERTSAHLRRLTSTSIPFSLSALNTALDECLGHFPIDRGTGVLPVRQKVPPKSRTWVETMSVMPNVKGRRKRGGDKAYRAGESSTG